MTLECATTRSTLWRWYWRSLRRNEVHRTIWLGWMLGAFLAGFYGAHASGKADLWAAGAGPRWVHGPGEQVALIGGLR